MISRHGSVTAQNIVLRRILPEANEDEIKRILFHLTSLDEPMKVEVF